MRKALLLLLAAASALGQNPQTQTAPIYPVNSKYVNGTAPGYWATAGAGLILNVSAGQAFCGGSIHNYGGGTLSMTGSVTNYVYLDTSSSCGIAVKTTAFTAADIPIATVVAGSSAITSIADDRLSLQQAGGSGLVNPMTTQGDLIVGGASGSPARLAAGTSGYVLTSTGPGATPAWQAAGGSSCPASWQCLSTASDLGAQINAADTALGSAGGVIYMPAGTYSQSTTGTITHLGISLIGAGPKATVINCTINADCIALHPNFFTATPPNCTTTDCRPSAAEVAGFAIIGNSGTAQTLIHGQDLIGWTLHDLSIDGSQAIPNATTHVPTGACLTFENVNYWTERNYTYNVQFGQNCYLPVALVKTGTYPSFGYNYFNFSMNPTHYGVYMEGGGDLYNGYLHVTANMNGGTLIRTDFGSAPSDRSERIALNAEGSGSFWEASGAAAKLWSGAQFTDGFTGQGTAFTDTFNLTDSSGDTYAASVSYAFNKAAHTSTNTAASGATFGFADSSLCPSGTDVCINLIGTAASANNAMAVGWKQSTGRGFLTTQGSSGPNTHAAEWDGLGNFYFPSLTSQGCIGTDSTGKAIAGTGCATSGSSISTALACADSSGSGTAQSCTTSPSFTPTTGACVIYSTTTANAGTGLTVNVNALGAKSVEKWLSTTTLAAGDVPAGHPVTMCYNGTSWDVMTIGNPPSGGSAGVSSINTQTGAFTFTGAGVSCSGTTCTFSGGGGPSPVTLTASSSTELDFSGANACFSTSYRDYEIRMSDITTTGTGVTVLIQYSTNGGTTWDTSTANYTQGRYYIGVKGGDAAGSNSNGSGGAGIVPSGYPLDTFTGSGFSVDMKVYHPEGTQAVKRMSGTFEGIDNSTTNVDHITWGGAYANSSAVNAFRIITTGTFSGQVTCQPLAQ